MALQKLQLTLEIDGDKAVVSGMRNVDQAIDNTSRTTTTATGKMAADMNNVETATGRMAAGFGGLNSVISGLVVAWASWELTQKIKEAALLAARVETLSVVMHTVGNNAGYSSGQMDAFTEQLKKMGITTQESMSSLIKMSSANMDLSKSSALARIAQDAAVIGNINSSEAFGRMIQGIRSGEVEILRTIGINVQFDQAYKKLAATLGKTSDSLTDTEKTQARMNAVQEYGVNLAGAYEASMSTAGKQLLSMARYTEELQLKLGQLFTPALTLMVMELVKSLKELDTSLSDNKGTMNTFGTGLADTFRLARRELSQISAFLDKVGGTATQIMAAIYGPGMMAGNKNSTEQFDKWMERNKTYEERYKANKYQGVEDSANIGNTEIDNADAAWKKAKEVSVEMQKIEAGNALRRKQAAVEKDAADKKELEKAEGQYKQYLNLFGQLQNRIADNDPFMDKFAQQIADVDLLIEKSVRDLPQYTDSIKDQGALVKAAMVRNRDFKQSMEREGQPDNADNWAKMYDNAAKSMEKFYKDQATLQRLNLDNQLAEINAAEKFYEITAGAAAEKRISLLEEALALDKEAYANAGENELLQAEYRKSIIDTNSKLLEQKKILADSTAIGGAIAALQEYGRAAQDVGAQTKGVVSDFLKGMEDALYSFARTGKLEFRSLIDSMINDIIRMQIRQQITGPMSSWLGSILSGSGSSNSAGGSGLLSSLFGGSGNGSSGLGGLISSLFNSGGGSSGSGGMLSAIGSWIGSLFTSGGGAATSGSAGASAASAGTSAASSSWSLGGMGYGPWLAMATYTYNWMSDYMGKGGEWNKKNTGEKSAIGFGSTNPLAPGAAMWLDYLSNGSFGGTAWRDAGSWLQMGVQAGQMNSQQLSMQSRKPGLFQGGENRFYWSDTSATAKSAFAGALDNVFAMLTSGAKQLGAAPGAVDQFRSTFSMAPRLLLPQWGQSQTQIMQGYFNSVFAAAISGMYPNISEFSKVGEGVTGTFKRLTVAIGFMSDQMVLLGSPIQNIGLQTAAAASAVIDALGGLEKAAGAFDAYYKSGIFTQAEQEIIQLKSAQIAVNRTFTELNLAVPATNTEFKDLVNTFIEMGDGGTVSALMSVAGSFATITASADAAGQALIQAAQANLVFYQQLKDSALAAINDFQRGNLSILSPEQKYAQAQAEFETARILAAAGDQSAMQGLPQVVNRLLENSRIYNASTAAYGNDYAASMAALQGVVSYSDMQLNPITAPSAGSADSVAVVEEIKTLKVELVKIVSKLADIESPLKRVVNAVAVNQ